MSTLTIIGILAIALVGIAVLWGVIGAPLLRKAMTKKQDEKLLRIIAGFKKDDKILLASGIRGYFVKIKQDIIYVEIAKGVIIRVDKHAVMGIYK